MKVKTCMKSGDQSFMGKYLTTGLFASGVFMNDVNKIK